MAKKAPKVGEQVMASIEFNFVLGTTALTLVCTVEQVYPRNRMARVRIEEMPLAGLAYTISWDAIGEAA